MAQTNATVTKPHVTRLSAALGAEIRGIDLASISSGSAADTDSTVQLIWDLLHEHQVLFFPEQHLEQAAHVAFGRHFGKLEGHPNLKNAFTDHPEIFELAASKGGIADEWHTDLTFLPNPSIMSILNMVECPEVGGDTRWANLYSAYDALSAPLRELCDGLTALHDALPHNRPEKMTVHPVVRVHPVTGRRALYVNEHFTRRIVEMSHDESDAFLGLLTGMVKQDRFTVRYKWDKGTIAMWDNRCTQHSVLNDFEGERIIQRVTIMGDVVEGSPARWDRWPGSRRSALSRFDRQLSKFFDPDGSSGFNQHDAPE